MAPGIIFFDRCSAAKSSAKYFLRPRGDEAGLRGSIEQAVDGGENAAVPRQAGSDRSWGSSVVASTKVSAEASELRGRQETRGQATASRSSEEGWPRFAW